jgi:cation transport ATPase
MLYAVGIGVWVTGVLYWTFDHYMLRQTDIGLSENPLQVWWLRLHAATATLAIWLLGYMSAIHVQRNWSSRQRRYTGLLFVSAFGALVASGYLLYYVEADRPEMFISTLHWVIGLCVPAAFLLHRGLRRRRRAVSAAAQHAQSGEPGPLLPAPRPVDALMAGADGGD